VSGYLYNHQNLGRPSIHYLDDCGIFKRYTGTFLRPECAVRNTTIPYATVPPDQSHGYLDLTISPWLSQALGVPSVALGTLRASIREIFSNIADHSTQNIGGMHIQYFPNKNTISVSISDFGIGIPSAMRQSFTLKRDCDAIAYALVEGVSTRAGPRRSGFGLPFIVRNIVTGNQGKVDIHSGWGKVACFQGAQEPQLVPSDTQGLYPGTLVSIELQTDRIRQAVERREDLEWDQ